MLCPHCNQTNAGNITVCVHCGGALAGGVPAKKIMQSRFTIQKSLGSGGMGALYLASESIANRQRSVVVKEMLDYFDPSDPRSKANARRRFESEAETLASLNVPGVPQIFDYFSEGGRNYIVMQFVEGQNLEAGLTHVNDLDSLVRGRPYPVDQVRQWGVKVCQILEKLDAQDVIHMDIKPANLIVDKAGEIWLVDFGTAKAKLSPRPAQIAAAKKSSVYGTMGYAPPEQLAGKPEARSDVYALAATLYHLMTDDDPSEKPGKFPLLGRLPVNVSKALKQALTADVRRRITAAEFGRLLGNLPGGGPAFRWRDGTASYEPRGLVAVADRNWKEALGYFQGGEWANWLKDLHRHDLLAQMQGVQSQQPNADLAMDAFLRLLDPSLPAPRLEVSPSSLDAGALPWQAKHKINFKVSNRGSGCLEGRFAHLPSPLQVESTELAVHDELQVELTLDSGELSPSSQPQTLVMEINAGGAGRVRLPVRVLVPEPILHLEENNLDLESAYRGEEVAAKIEVSNPGGSQFWGAASSSESWLRVTPKDFLCSPLDSKSLQLEIHTHQLAYGDNSARLKLQANAGDWEQEAQVRVHLNISRMRTFWRNWGPLLRWMGAGAAYGALVGAVLGRWLGSLAGNILETSTGAITGALFGVLIYTFIGVIIGWFDGIGDERGVQGAKKGALYGLLGGGGAGALFGLLIYRFLSWLGFGLSAGLGFDLFGLALGLVIGAILGVVLWLGGAR